MDRYVFFDFDGTLTRRDSFFGFLRYLHGTAGMMRILLAELPSIVRGMLKGDEGRAKQRVLKRALRGMDRNSYLKACEEFAATIPEIERLPVVKALDDAVKAGCHVAVVSASPADWIRPWAALHGVKEVIATECRSDSTETLGEFITPNCSGSEKVRRILEKWPDLKSRRNSCHVTAYGNSSGDREMLAFADKAVKVPIRRPHPDYPRVSKAD